MLKIGDIIDNYKVLGIAGRGSYGCAYKAINIYTNVLVVLKEIPLFTLKESDITNLKHEVALLKRLDHPFIIKYYDSFNFNNSIYIVMEYASNGDLHERIISQKKPFDVELLYKWTIQLLLGIQYLHMNKIIHRDIKPQNIFIMEDGTCRIGDFGISRILQYTCEKAFTPIGTPLYTSPEICSGIPYGMETDLWSFGCVLYELLSFSPPFHSKSLGELMNKIRFAQYTPLSNNVDEELRTIAEALLNTNPGRRLIPLQILSRPQMKKRVNLYYPQFGYIYETNYQNHTPIFTVDELQKINQHNTLFGFVKPEDNTYGNRVKHIILNKETIKKIQTYQKTVSEARKANQVSQVSHEHYSPIVESNTPQYEIESQSDLSITSFDMSLDIDTINQSETISNDKTNSSSDPISLTNDSQMNEFNSSLSCSMSGDHIIQSQSSSSTLEHNKDELNPSTDVPMSSSTKESVHVSFSNSVTNDEPQINISRGEITNRLAVLNNWTLENDPRLVYPKDEEEFLAALKFQLRNPKNKEVIPRLVSSNSFPNSKRKEMYITLTEDDQIICVSSSGESENENENENNQEDNQVKYVSKLLTDKEILNMFPDSNQKGDSCKSCLVSRDMLEENKEMCYIEPLKKEELTKNKQNPNSFKNWKPSDTYNIHIHPIPGLEKHLHKISLEKKK